jgi:rRNA small subunit aminocarboxypropyltransferase
MNTPDPESSSRKNQDTAAPQLYVLQLRQDDPKKCTAAKLVRFGLAKPLYRPRQVPRESLVLNPFAPKYLLNQDRVRALNHGVVAIDCSWEKAQLVFETRLPGGSRRLPTLLAANPVNYAKPSKLTSLEALAASLYIMGFQEKAVQLLSIFKWAPHFLTLNNQPLDAYSSAQEETQLREAMSEFF